MRYASLLVLAAVLLTSGCGPSPKSREWPSGPVRLIVPFGAGTSSDLAARLFAPLLAARWGQAVVVDNRPGGDGVVGAQAFVNARDRNTLLFAPTGLVTTNPMLHDNLPYDPAKDLVPIVSAGRPNIGIAAVASLGVTTLAELVARVRAHPGRYIWAGTPGLPDLVFRGFMKLEQLDMKHVSYRDIAAAVQDLRAGRVHVMIAAVPTLAPALQRGTAQLLAVTSSSATVVGSNVPTARDAGYPALTVDGLFGFWGWRGMGPELRERIAEDVRAAATDSNLTARLARVGFLVQAGTPGQFADAVTAQRDQVATIARIVGVTHRQARGRSDVRVR
jgi:tripartite-type tricarboxylate transporter receptor subunit TctC